MMDNQRAGIFADPESLIGLRFDAKLLKLDLSKGARSILSGQHGSRFRGRGMDYCESRRYQPGDDVRSIDWRVTARTGQTHTKIYIEERERPIFIMVDFSASLYFGTRDTFKSVLAARAAALLAWAAVLQGDRVGGVLVSRDKVVDLKPKASRRGALAMINALSEISQTHPGFDSTPQLTNALRHLNAVVHPGSLVIILSDFLHIDQNTERLLSKIHQHNDVVLCQLLDPVEIAPLRAGRYAMTDRSDSGQTALIETETQKGREKYLEHFKTRQNKLASIAQNLKVPLLNLINGEDLISTLSSGFSQ